MTETEYIEKLKKLINEPGLDNEIFHIELDELLAEIIKDVLKWDSFIELYKKHTGGLWYA